jgi:hypothetical protein
MLGHLRLTLAGQIGLDAREGRGCNYKPSLLHDGFG